MKYCLLLPFILLSACSFKKSGLENQIPIGHTELYSEPNLSAKNKNDGHKRIIIAATNDIHGHYGHHQISFTDRSHEENQVIGVGGADFISSYFKILRKHYGEVLLVDAGDIFSEKPEELNYVSDFYSSLKYDAITVGLKDFNLKLPSKYPSSSEYFKEFAAKTKTPTLMSNLYELKTARGVEWTGTLPYLLKEVNGVKVGIIGLIPDDIVEQTPIDNRIGFYVESMLQSTLKHSRLLRSLGAEIIVVLTHQGLSCGEEMSQSLGLPISKVNFEPKKKNVCDLSNKMGAYLSRLPANLVDVVIGGRTHQKVANIINTTLVMSNLDDGQSFSYAEFFVDKKTKKVSHDHTVVHQPVYFCHEFFKETNDCYTEDASVNHGLRVPAKFLGQEVKADSQMTQKFKSFLEVTRNKINLSPGQLQPIMDFYDASITYEAQGSHNSKLMLLQIKGSELADILEKDFNQGNQNFWKPSPFKVHENTLSLTIQGSPIEVNTQYQILISLVDSQKHLSLRKFISRTENKSLHHVSWNEPGINKDDVSTALSASETVR